MSHQLTFTSVHNYGTEAVIVPVELRFNTVTGGFNAYGHIVTVKTFGHSFDVMVYFAAFEAFTRNVLGRRGWLDQVQLGLVEYESTLYLNRYGSQPACEPFETTQPAIDKKCDFVSEVSL